jgi:hypothetical protein
MRNYTTPHPTTASADVEGIARRAGLSNRVLLTQDVLSDISVFLKAHERLITPHEPGLAAQVGIWQSYIGNLKKMGVTDISVEPSGKLAQSAQSKSFSPSAQRYFFTPGRDDLEFSILTHNGESHNRYVDIFGMTCPEGSDEMVSIFPTFYAPSRPLELGLPRKSVVDRTIQMVDFIWPGKKHEGIIPLDFDSFEELMGNIPSDMFDILSKKGSPYGVTHDISFLVHNLPIKDLAELERAVVLERKESERLKHDSVKYFTVADMLNESKKMRSFYRPAIGPIIEESFRRISRFKETFNLEGSDDQDYAYLMEKTSEDPASETGITSFAYRRILKPIMSVAKACLGGIPHQEYSHRDRQDLIRSVLTPPGETSYSPALAREVNIFPYNIPSEFYPALSHFFWESFKVAPRGKKPREFFLGLRERFNTIIEEDPSERDLLARTWLRYDGCAGAGKDPRH